MRLVSAAELHADALIEQSETPAVEDGMTPTDDGDATPRRTNVNIIDDTLNQKLTMAEIEALKQDAAGSGKELISKLLASHSTLDQKTAFSLAKYTLRKNRKYLRRFCVLPVDVAQLADWMMTERDFGKVLEIRNDTMSLMASWANVHASCVEDDPGSQPASRYIVVDDTGGLIVAMLAERIEVLHPTKSIPDQKSDDEDEANSHDTSTKSTRKPPSAHMPACRNTITLIHANTQPNLSLLRYFSYDYSNPTTSHPLYTHLKTLTWLQLLDPASDSAYREPQVASPSTLAIYKGSKRSKYHRKRRRWQRTAQIVDETRAGAFNGLVVASHTDPKSILHHLVPLVAGGSQVVVYSPHVEPLVELADVYSTARRTAFLNAAEEEGGRGRKVPSEDFPLDPTLLLGPTIHTARARRWQVLPGRTHPLMTGRGGAEGYLFVATRVIPAEGPVSARGRAPRKKQRNEDGAGAGVRLPVESASESGDEEMPAAMKTGREEEGE